MEKLLSMSHKVATVLTVYGIETHTKESQTFWHESVATVLTVYGIETILHHVLRYLLMGVATVLTVYGIETNREVCFGL